MRNKLMSIFVYAMMVVSISSSITQNVGELDLDGGLGLAPSNISEPAPQVVGQPSLSSGGSGGLADSPWPMFRQNLNHTGLSPYDTSANLGKLKWNFMTGNYVISSPAIGPDGSIYVGSSDKMLYAINPNGSEKWSFTTGGEVRSSPTISSDSTIYIGSYDNKLYAINPDGTEKWSYMTGGVVHSSPAIGPDGTIYVGSYDNKLYAINPNCTEKWNFETGGVVHSSPAIGPDGIIYFGTNDNKLYAIYPNGSQKWNFTTSGDVRSSPAIGPNGTIYVGSYDNKLYAINPDGSGKWSFKTSSDVSASPAIDSNMIIYIGNEGNKLYAIKHDGTEKWNFTTQGGVASPSIGSDGTIYFGADDDKLYAINPNGIEKWSFTVGDDVHSSPAIGSDGTIYIGSDDSKLYAIGTPAPNITVEKIVNVTHTKPGDTITYTIYYNNTLTSDPTGELVHQQLTFEDSDQRYPSYSPDGSEIVFSSFEDGGSIMDIWIMDVDGSNHQQLTFENASQEDPSFSPGGSKIVYYSYEDLDGEEDIWIMNSDGSNHQQLTDVEAQRYPNFSPDGSKIVYISQEDGGVEYDIWIMNSDGTNHQQLTFEDVEQFYPSFSPNGSKIVYSSYEDGGLYEDIWIMNADGSDHQQLTNEDVDQLWPVFSPDGENITYQSKEDGGSYYDIWILTMSSETIAKTVWLNDTLPTDVTFVTSSAEANRTGNYNWTFYNIEPGEYNFTITVQVNAGVPNGTILTNYVHLDCTDYKGNSMLGSSDSVDVIVIVDELIPPIADAGLDQTVNEGDVVQFDGSGSYIPSAQILSESQPDTGKIGESRVIRNAEFDAKQGVIYDIPGYLVRIDLFLYTEGYPWTGDFYDLILSFTDESGNLLGSAWSIADKNMDWYVFNFSTPIRLTTDTLYYISVEAPDQHVYPLWVAYGFFPDDPYPKAHGYFVGLQVDDFTFKTYLAGSGTETLSYEWDFDASDGLWWETGTLPDATGPTPTHTYGDDGKFIVTLR